MRRAARGLMSTVAGVGALLPPAVQPPLERADPAPVAAPAPGAAPTHTLRGTVEVSGNWGIQKPDLTRAVVYLASDPQIDAEPPPAEPAIVGQKNKAFVPGFLAVSKGTTVEFPNWDDFDHNVFSRSKAAPAFDLDRYPRGQSKSRVFEKVGVVQVFCNIHPGMRAIVFVTPNRRFTRADAQGRFELAGVPAGTREIVVWHDRCAEQRLTVEVGPATAELTVRLEENRKAILENSPPKREDGYGIERGLGVKREKLGLPVVEDAHPAPVEPPK